MLNQTKWRGMKNGTQLIKSNQSYFYGHVKTASSRVATPFPCPFVIRTHSWHTFASNDNTTNKASRSCSTVTHNKPHSRRIVIPRTTTSAAAPTPCHRSQGASLACSPEPLMCAGTRDRPPPRLTAVWWRNRPTRVDDVHRTSAAAVDGGTIDAVRPDGRRRAHARSRNHARESLPPRARDTSEWPEGEKKKKEPPCAFIYGYGVSQAWRVISLGDSSLSLVENSPQRVGGSVPRMRRARAQPVDRSTLHGG